MRHEDFTFLKHPILLPSPSEGNDLFPLPPDYHDLTKDGQRLARVNASSMYRAKGSRPEHFVASWRFFTHEYLHHDEAFFFDLPMGQDEPLPTPWFHYDMALKFASYPRVTYAAPRGAAKSYFINQSVLLLIFTLVNFSMSIMLAVYKMMVKRFNLFKYQISHNPRLIEDFGMLKPVKGEGAFSSEGELILRNQVQVNGLTVDGRARGARPGTFWLDDPEYDEDATTDMAVLRWKFSRLLFKIIVPMMRRNCPVFWAGTIISRRHLLYQAWEGKDTRFGQWTRVLLPAVFPDGTALWPEWKTTEEVEGLRTIMGSEEVDAEYFNMPGERAGSTFKFNPNVHEAYATDIDDDLEMEQGNPWESKATIVYPQVSKNGEVEEVSSTVPKLLDRIPFRFTCIDAAVTWNPESDYTAIITMGLDHRNVLWVLDVFADRVSEDAQINEFFRQVVKWRCTLMAGEDVGIQKSVNSRIQTRFIQEAYNLDLVPYFHHVKNPTRTSKTQRISGALTWRFRNNLIMLGGWLRYHPSYQMMIDQVKNFNSSMTDGGIPFDDILDCMSQSQDVCKSRPGAPEETPRESKELVSLLERGEFVDPRTGLDHRQAIFQNGIPAELYAKLMSRSIESRDRLLRGARNGDFMSSGEVRDESCF